MTTEASPSNVVALPQVEFARQLRRLREALDRMPHPSWSALSEPPRLVGDYVYDRMTEADRAALRRNMQRCAKDDAELHFEWYRDLGNVGIGAGDENPTPASMRNLLERLAVVRTEPRCDTWSSLLSGLSESSREDDRRIAALFEKASGISDALLFGGPKFGGALSAEQEAAGREAVDRLNAKRDALAAEGHVVPQAHADLGLFYSEA